MKLTTITVRGGEYDVHVNDEGKFHADIDDATIYAQSLGELTERLNKATKVKQAKVEIPFVRWNREKVQIERGVIVGMHATNRSILVRIDGKSKQDSLYGDSPRYLRMTAQEESNYSAMRVAYEDLHRQIILIEKSHKIDAATEIQLAILALDSGKK